MNILYPGRSEEKEKERAEVGRMMGEKKRKSERSRKNKET